MLRTSVLPYGTLVSISLRSLLTKLIKIGAKVVRHSRIVTFHGGGRGKQGDMGRGVSAYRDFAKGTWISQGVEAVFSGKMTREESLTRGWRVDRI